MGGKENIIASWKRVGMMLTTPAASVLTGQRKEGHKDHVSWMPLWPNRATFNFTFLPLGEKKRVKEMIEKG